MANQVFANGMEIACKAGAGKVITAFPDVCMTPPENPATSPGIPVPYPNTGFASDTTDGSKNVKISGKEVMLKNKSCFKTSVGDEAGCAAKKGVVSSKNKGKVYFVKWSMDVKIEGENVDRHLDMTTNNHGSPTANEGVPWVFLDGASQKAQDFCQTNREEEQEACGYDKEKQEYKMKPLDECGDSEDCKKCKKARECMLVPYGKSGSPNCCPGYTGDHLIDVKNFIIEGGDRKKGPKETGWDDYDVDDAPTMCVEGHAAGCKSHGILSTKRKAFINALGGKGQAESLEIVAMVGAITAADTFGHCNVDCMEEQLLNYHRGVQENNAEVKMSQYGAGEGLVGSAKREMSDGAKALAKDWN